MKKTYDGLDDFLVCTLILIHAFHLLHHRLLISTNCTVGSGYRHQRCYSATVCINLECCILSSAWISNCCANEIRMEVWKGLRCWWIILPGIRHMYIIKAWANRQTGINFILLSLYIQFSTASTVYYKNNRMRGNWTLCLLLFKILTNLFDTY